jgi:hypothetical protein
MATMARLLSHQAFSASYFSLIAPSLRMSIHADSTNAARTAGFPALVMRPIAPGQRMDLPEQNRSNEFEPTGRMRSCGRDFIRSMLARSVLCRYFLVHLPLPVMLVQVTQMKGLLCRSERSPGW